jgi:hypothetical protein
MTTSNLTKEFWKQEAMRLERAAEIADKIIYFRGLEIERLKKEAKAAYISGQIAGLRKLKDDFATPKSQKEVQEKIEPYIRQAVKEFADEMETKSLKWVEGVKFPADGTQVLTYYEWQALRRRWGI